jgi:hypothetical protein
VKASGSYPLIGGSIPPRATIIRSARRLIGVPKDRKWTQARADLYAARQLHRAMRHTSMSTLERMFPEIKRYNDEQERHRIHRLEMIEKGHMKVR